MTLCYDCLTDDDNEIEAVTARQGTPLCKKCANELAEADRNRDAALEERQAQISESLSNFGRPRFPLG